MTVTIAVVLSAILICGKLIIAKRSGDVFPMTEVLLLITAVIGVIILSAAFFLVILVPKDYFGITTV